MSLESAVKTVLAADATLLAILTGGVHSWVDTGRNGLSPETVEDAYDEGFLLPCAIIRERTTVPWGGGHDVAAQTETMRGMVEVYLYEEGNGDGSALNSAYARIIRLLNQRFVAGAGRLKRTNRLLGLRDPDVSNALMQRADFQVVFIER